MTSRKALRNEVAQDLRKRLEALGGANYGLPMSEIEYIPVDRISTGSLLVDNIFGGGIPRGQITELYGAEGSGKTTLCYSVIGQCQADGGTAVFIDAEHSFDPWHAAKFGVDMDSLVYISPPDGDTALETVRAFSDAKAAALIVVDSVAALVPKAELRGEIGDAQVAMLPRLMSQALRILPGTLHASNTALIFTNQLREKVGVMFGNPEMTPGGRALRHYASLRAQVRRGEWVKDGDAVIGMTSRVRTEKNKGAAPFQSADVRLLFDSGYDKVRETLDVALTKGIMQRAGAWISYQDQKWQGGDAVIAAFSEHPDFYAEVLTKCRE